VLLGAGSVAGTLVLPAAASPAVRSDVDVYFGDGSMVSLAKPREAEPAPSPRQADPRPCRLS
jgi:hypothetical protein